MPSPVTCRLADPHEQIAAQRAVIRRFEAALWDGGFNESLLASYQSAWRRLESLIAALDGDDGRHHFVIVIPVADSPQQLRACLDSLDALCNLYGYGGRHDARWRKVSVMIADDTEDARLIAAHRAIAAEFDARGFDTHYFGLDEQRALLAALPDPTALSRIVGAAQPALSGHKGQAIMRNIAWLKVAQMRRADAALLVYTLDADQTFKVKVATADGDHDVYAVNFLAQLDAIFSATDADVLTGRVVGDPPVSPAVMAGNFLADVMLFSIERLTALGYPQQAIATERIAATLDSVQCDMLETYRAKHRTLVDTLAHFQTLLNDPQAWWNQSDALAAARACFEAFGDNPEYNFGTDSRCRARIDAADSRLAWRQRQLDAIANLQADRRAWDNALATLAQT